jgi:hypothetical protein
MNFPASGWFQLHKQREVAEEVIAERKLGYIAMHADAPKLLYAMPKKN